MQLGVLVGVCRFSGNHWLLAWILMGQKFVCAVSSKCVCLCVYVCMLACVCKSALQCSRLELAVLCKPASPSPPPPALSLLCIPISESIIYKQLFHYGKKNYVCGFVTYACSLFVFVHTYWGIQVCCRIRRCV